MSEVESPNEENFGKLYNQYFKWQKDFQDKYGPKTLVLCQVGAFFEVYGVDNDFEQIGVTDEISKLLNIQCTLKNKKKGPGSNRKNPKMCGFQPPYLQRHLEILLNDDWTVVVIEQVTPPPNPKRDITRIYSPGTYLSNEFHIDNNYIASIYLQGEKCYQTQKDIFVVGLSAVDVSTGENVVHYFNSSPDDKQVVEEGLFRFIETYNPREVIINWKNVSSQYQEKFMEGLDFSHRIKYESTLTKGDNLLADEIEKISYQNQFLHKIFPKTGYLDPIEYLDLEKSPAGVISYIALLKFVYEHSPNIISKINLPSTWCQSQNLILSHNTIYQLDVLPGNQLDSHSRFKSLFHVIDQTRTPMGKRLLKHHLLNPIYDIKELNRRYNLISPVLDLQVIKLVQQSLNDIMDIERRHRKMFLHLLQPHELAEMEISYQSVLDTFKYIEKYYPGHQDGLLGHQDGLPSHQGHQGHQFQIEENDLNKFQEYFQEYQAIFDLEEMIKYSFKNLDKSFFHKGYFPEVDVVQDQMDNLEKKLKETEDYLCQLINQNMNQSKTSVPPVTLEKTEKEGYFYKITTLTRVNALKKELEKLPEDERKRFILKKVGNSITKIYLDDDSFEKLKDMKEKIRKVVFEAYQKIIEKFYEKYHETFQKIHHLIAEFDVVVSHAKTALIYGYHKPVVADHSVVDGSQNEINYSYLEAKDLRHPIAERINLKTNYVTNDIHLGGNHSPNGMLLFGVNSSGKSCLLKGVGLSVIMAQIGMYVPASSFVYYPFKTIFTRISGNDNMFKGKSSFTVEMYEMKSILKYSNQYSLVLGDEICKGTEHISALSIVATVLQWLSKNNSKFILATHLHELSELSVISTLENLALKHLEVNYDPNQDVYIYNRKLKDGSGESNYGLLVAKYIINLPEFIESATEISNALYDQTNALYTQANTSTSTISLKNILNPEKSNYNSQIYTDSCQICGTKNNIDQHHIIYQSNCDQNGLAQHIPMNNPSNLAFLCKKHHQEVHQDKLVIQGYVTTSYGIHLDYYFVKSAEEKKEKKLRNLKFTTDQVEIIKSYKKMMDEGKTKKLIAFYLQKNHDINISTNTLKKIFEDKYLDI